MATESVRPWQLDRLSFTLKQQFNGSKIVILECGPDISQIGFIDGSIATGPKLSKNVKTCLSLDECTRLSVSKSSDLIRTSLLDTWKGILDDLFGEDEDKSDYLLFFTLPVYEYKCLEHVKGYISMAIEDLGFSGVYVAPTSLTCLFGCGSLSGLVIELGRTFTSTATFMSPYVILPIGPFLLPQLIKDVQSEEGKRLIKSVSNEDLLEDENLADKVANRLSSDINFLKFDLVEDENEETLPEKDTIEMPFDDYLVQINGSIGRILGERLYFSQDGPFNLPNAVSMCLSGIDQGKVSSILDSLFLCCKFPGDANTSAFQQGIQKRLSDEIQNTALCMSEYCSVDQPKSVHWIKVPDYYPQIKGRNDLASWHGASVLSKVVFGDPKAFISKEDFFQNKDQIIRQRINQNYVQLQNYQQTN